MEQYTNMNKKTLHEIGLKFNTDKSWDHGYMNFYEQHINPSNVNRFLEIGIYRGESIKTWREWFPQKTIIEGWDIQNIPNVEGCDLRNVNQINRDEMKNNITGLYDVILDDGAHTAESIQTSFSFLFPYTKMYIIEDLHAAWWGEAYKKVDDVSSIDLLNELKDNKTWNSKYSLKNEKEYIEKNAEVFDIFWKGSPEDLSSFSITCIVKNKLHLT